MVTRRDLIALGAALPFTIPRIDWKATQAADPTFTENTDAGIGLDVMQDLGFSDLLQLASYGPYLRYAWLDLEPGQELPTVRGMFWANLYNVALSPTAALRLGINLGDGWRDHESPVEPGLDRFGPVEGRIVTDIIRLLIRTHYGVETRFVEV